MANAPADHHNSFLVNAIRQLDSGVAAHTRWLGGLHKAIICGTPADESVTNAESHRHCALGKWLHGELAADWEPWASDLAHIETLHRSMHGHARELYLRRQHGTNTIPADYDVFLESSIRLKFALRALGFRLIDEVCLVDQLTGVWNRSSMFKRLAEEQDRMLRSSQPCCLCMMDLDHFKAVNDTHGHIAGDKVLQTVVEIANARLRAYDAVFRYGGEEFLFCLPNAPLDIALAAMERVRADIEETVIPLRDGQSVRVTASFGVAVLSATLSLEESIEAADKALFCAKAKGRNMVCRWDVQ